MQKLWKKLAVVATAVCLATGVFCIIGCGDNTKSGTVYQYKTSSYTDTYNLYDDESYKRIYEGGDYYGSVVLEIGTYKTNGSSLSFKGTDALGDGAMWPSGTVKYYTISNPYSGSLNTNLLISGTTYTKHGSITKTSN